MTALCSLCKAQTAAAAAVLFGGLAAILPWVPGIGGPIAAMVAGGLAALSGVSALYFLGRARRWTRATAEVCTAVAAGDFERRLIRITEGGELRDTLLAVNALIDVTDAFTREAGAAMEYVSANKFYRTIRTEGLGGHFKRSADRINAATKAMEARVAHFAELTDQFDANVHGVMNAVASAAEQMRSTSGSLAGLANDTTSQTSAVAAATEQASSNVQTVAAAAEQLSASIGEIRRQVDEATGTTATATQRADAAGRIVHALAEAADEIGSVVTLIADIAEKTNLLALNATIEAARAGEAGKGFAVVAGEVKNLANQTGQATQRIGTQVDSIRSATREAVDAIGQITRAVGEVDRLTDGISNAVSEQSDATGEISRSVQEASTGTADVARNIGLVSGAASDADRAARDVAETARSLAEQSGHLKAAVASYLAAARAA